MPQHVSTCLWFNGPAKEAAEFYVSLIPNSRILEVTYFPEGVPGPAGTVLAVRLVLDGNEYMFLNGGPAYTLSPAASIVVWCKTQAEVDRLWDALLEGGAPMQCGWLTDRFGVSWQVAPAQMFDFIFSKTDTAAALRAFNAMTEMVKLDISAIQRAYDGA